MPQNELRIGRTQHAFGIEQDDRTILVRGGVFDQWHDPALARDASAWQSPWRLGPL
jgi:hypothetical protein